LQSLANYVACILAVSVAYEQVCRSAIADLSQILELADTFVRLDESREVNVIVV